MAGPVTGPAPLPVTGLDHIGLVVPDLDRSARLFADVLGARELHRSRRGGDDEFMRLAFDVPPGLSFELAMLELPGGVRLELFEWRTAAGPAGGPPHPAAHQPGGHHVCLCVPDAEAAAAALAADPRVTVLGGVKQVPDGPRRDVRWCYARTDWGLLLELVQHPAPLAR
jgi:catechol 2,3-dioxygenase-like lactoylglutathione lyase family enzyme